MLITFEKHFNSIDSYCLVRFKVHMNRIVTEKFSYWYCDQCYRTFKHGEFRHNCTVCDDFDLCEDCLTTFDPSHPHRLTRELAYGSEERIEKAQKPTMASGIQTAIVMYHDRYCLGVRDADKTNPSLYKDTYSWLTFKTVGIRSKNFGYGLRSIIEPRGYLGICARNCPEWVITDFACIFQSIITVPIYCLFSNVEIAYIINNTSVSVVICDEQTLPRFIRLQSDCPFLRHIVCIDYIPETVHSQYTYLIHLVYFRIN